MKKHYLLIFILTAFLSSYQMSAQTLRAVNDTIDLYPGIPKTVNLLQNDTVTLSDSLKLTFNIPTLVSDTNIYQGFYSFVVKQWGFNGNQTGNYTIHDHTLGKNSTATILFRIHDHSYDSLNINNVNAAITPYGNEFYLPGSGRSVFKIPKDSLTGTVGGFSLWLGGKGDDSTLYLAAEEYGQGPGPVYAPAGTKPDFHAGPVMDSVNYSIYQDTAWNRVWKIQKSEIEYHKTHWNNPGYNAPVNIRSWPGNGNTAYGEADQLASYHDNNGDGKYNAADGDYPSIMGDEAIFAIYNDDRDIHKETGGKKMRIEIHVMAYAFNLPEDSAFKNTIFLNYKIFNRSSRPYYNTYMGLFGDIDLGYYLDDYMGCDVGRNSIIGYNGLGIDGTAPWENGYGSHPPAQSVTILGGPFMDPTGTDRPRLDPLGHQLCNESVNGTGFGDSIANNERYGLTNFLALRNGIQSYNTDPINAGEFYYNMQSIWRDSTHLFYGGMGHSGYGGYGPDCRFAFPGETDTLNWGTGCQLPDGQKNWTMTIAGATPGDIRGIGSMGPFTFRPGDVQELDVAFIFARDYNSQDTVEQSVAKLRQMIDIVRNSYNTGKLSDGNSFFGIDDQPNTSSNKLKIYPNPASDKITIEIKSQNIANSSLLSVYNIQGQLMFEKPVSQRSTNIDISAMARGVYIVKLTTNKNIEVSRFVKE